MLGKDADAAREMLLTLRALFAFAKRTHSNAFDVVELHKRNMDGIQKAAGLRGGELILNAEDSDGKIVKLVAELCEEARAYLTAKAAAIHSGASPFLDFSNDKLAVELKRREQEIAEILDIQRMRAAGILSEPKE